MADNSSQRRASTLGSSSSVRRRQRAALACVSCRRSKVRCDRRQPCGACVRSRHKTCIYDVTSPTLRGSGILAEGTTANTTQATLADASLATPDHTDTDSRAGDLSKTLCPVTPASESNTRASLPPAVPPGHEGSNRTGTTTAIATSTQVPGPNRADGPPLSNIDTVLDRLFRLEQRLDGSAATAQGSTDRNPRREHAYEEAKVLDNYLAVDIHEMSRSVVSKTRCFGQSHWMNSVIHFRPLLELFDQQPKDAKSEAIAVLNRCKALARTIKSQRYPAVVANFGTNIPTRDVADKLVDGYLRTLETVFRVLHVPTFKRDYEKFWEAPDAAGIPFTIQLQLVMAIGATIYDATFTLRKSAVQWVAEAQHWLLGPPEKGKLTITGLQIMILLALARETAAMGGDLSWIHVGSLLRSALCMGLHRDPSRLPRMPRLEAEMRRRLWNTIMEIELKTSADSGGYPMITLDMADTRAPADVDDVDLMEDEPVTNVGGAKSFTDMTVPLLLRDSFRERLAIYQMLNATPFRGTYDDVIRLHRRFMAAFKALMGKLKELSSSRQRLTSFQCRLVEIVARRCLMNLHLPYLGPSFRDPAFAFSRAQVMEASTKTYYLVFPEAATCRPTDSLLPSEGPSEILSTEGDDLARLVLCGASFWRLIATQPSLVAALELQMAAQEEHGLGPPILRPDLLNIIRHSLPLYHSRIEAGETNIKGYLIIVAVASHVQATIEGRVGRQLIEPVLTAAIRTERLCFEILKRQAGSPGPEDYIASPSDDTFNWDSLMAVDGGWGDAAAMRSLFEVTSVEAFLGENEGFDFSL